jgi:iron(III) transport system permease protein
MEEAAQTLRAERWQTFRTVSLPLMRPGLANAFLLGFIESMADFGNPLVLGGNFDVLSTEIFFAIVGAQYDQGRAAVLAMVLLFFTLSAFYAQRLWLGKKSYTTVTGKGDAGVHPLMPHRLAAPVLAIAGFWGRLYGDRLRHDRLWQLRRAVGRQQHADLQALRHSLLGRLRGARHPLDRRRLGQFLDHDHIAAIAAPLTAAVGLITAYLLTRQSFAGKNAFEFGTMLSFAIPGTVIGVSYILASTCRRSRSPAPASSCRQLHLPQHAGRRARRHRQR